MIHGLFRAARSRHPLARLAIGILGVVAVVLFVTVGMFALAALLIVGALLVLVNALRSGPRSAASAGAASTSTAASPDVIEGEFKIVPTAPTQRAPRTASHYETPL